MIPISRRHHAPSLWDQVAALLATYGPVWQRATPVRAREKAPGDWVTPWDRRIQRTLTDALTSLVPDSGVWGEEGPPLREPLSRYWLVDPLDGTTNFVHRLPHWSVAIAYVEADTVLGAWVYEMPVGRLFTAWRGRGCQAAGRPARVRDPVPLAHALLGVGHPRSALAAGWPDFGRQAADIRRCGSAALALAYVAAGWLDGFLEARLMPWDWAAGALLITEAGGRVTDADGRPPALRAPGAILAAGPALHAGLLAHLADRTRPVA